MLTTVQSILAARRPPAAIPLRVVLPNGLALTGTRAGLAAVAQAIREEVRAQVRPQEPRAPITYTLPGQRPLQGSAQAWLRLATWIETAVRPPCPAEPAIRARFPIAGGTAAWMAPNAISGRTTRLVNGPSGSLGTHSLTADPQAMGVDPADPRSPLTSVPQQYRVRVLIPDPRFADGWGPHPVHSEEIEVWAGSLATASLFVVLDPQRPLSIEPGYLVAARWVWRVFQTPDTDRPWTHPYTCFLDAIQIAMIRLELDRQTELLI
jgi:hypothetical protein